MRKVAPKLHVSLSSFITKNDLKIKHEMGLNMEKVTVSSTYLLRIFIGNNDKMRWVPTSYMSSWTLEKDVSRQDMR